MPALREGAFSSYLAISLSFLMMYLIYSFFVTLGVLLTAPYYIWKRRDELVGRRWR